MFNKPLFGTSSSFGQSSLTPQAPTPNIFGASNSQPSIAQPFGLTSNATTPFFGNTPSQGSSLFGNAMTSTAPAMTPLGNSGGIFGSLNKTVASTPLFGTQPVAQTPTFNFGASLSQQPRISSGLFGFGGAQTVSQAQPMGLFGSTPTPGPTSTLFGSSTANISGTPIKFKATTTQDTMLKNGTNQTITAAIQCISAMKEYENKSLEELRWEDYVANRKVAQPQPATGGLFGAAPQPASSSMFGAFGQPKATITPFGGTSLFGQAQPVAATATTLGQFGQAFGQQNSFLGSVSSAAPSLFGTGSSLFGQPQANTTVGAGSIFGAAPTPTVGTGLFGTPGSQPAQPFGSSTPGLNLFGNAGAAAATSSAAATPFGFNFGGGVAAVAKTTASAFPSFFGGSAAATTTSAPSFLFPGQTAVPAAPSAFSFGATPAQQPFGTSSIFGTPATLNAPAPSGFNFSGGASSLSSLFPPAPTAPSSSATPSAFGLFGAPPLASKPFGSVTATTASAFNFGAAPPTFPPPSMFGAPTQTNFFGAAPPTTSTAVGGGFFGVGGIGATPSIPPQFPGASAPAFPGFGAPGSSLFAAPSAPAPASNSFFGGGLFPQPVPAPTASGMFGGSGLFGATPSCSAQAFPFNPMLSSNPLLNPPSSNMGAANFSLTGPGGGPMAAAANYQPLDPAIHRQIMDMVNVLPYGDVPLPSLSAAPSTSLFDRSTFMNPSAPAQSLSSLLRPSKDRSGDAQVDGGRVRDSSTLAQQSLMLYNRYKFTPTPMAPSMTQMASSITSKLEKSQLKKLFSGYEDEGEDFVPRRSSTYNSPKNFVLNSGSRDRSRREERSTDHLTIDSGSNFVPSPTPFGKRAGPKHFSPHKTPSIGVKGSGIFTPMGPLERDGLYPSEMGRDIDLSLQSPVRPTHFSDSHLSPSPRGTNRASSHLSPQKPYDRVASSDPAVHLFAGKIDTGLYDTTEEPTHQLLFKCTKPGYYTIPSVEECLEYVNDFGECFVEDFLIGRRCYGTIYFTGRTNVADLDIDNEVHIGIKDVEVYPDDKKKPPFGQGLNKSAQVTLENTWPVDRNNGTPIKDVRRLLSMNYQKRLENACRKMGVDFVEYTPETGTWIFLVPHFSRFRLLQSDEEGADDQSTTSQINPIQPTLQSTLNIPVFTGEGRESRQVGEPARASYSPTKLQRPPLHQRERFERESFGSDYTNNTYHASPLIPKFLEDFGSQLQRQRPNVLETMEQMSPLSPNLKTMKTALFESTHLEDDGELGSGTSIHPPIRNGYRSQTGIYPKLQRLDSKTIWEDTNTSISIVGTTTHERHTPTSFLPNVTIDGSTASKYSARTDESSSALERSYAKEEADEGYGMMEHEAEHLMMREREELSVFMKPRKFDVESSHNKRPDETDLLTGSATIRNIPDYSLFKFRPVERSKQKLSPPYPTRIFRPSWGPDNSLILPIALLSVAKGGHALSKGIDYRNYSSYGIMLCQVGGDEKDGLRDGTNTPDCDTMFKTIYHNCSSHNTKSSPLLLPYKHETLLTQPLPLFSMKSNPTDSPAVISLTPGKKDDDGLFNQRPDHFLNELIESVLSISPHSGYDKIWTLIKALWGEIKPFCQEPLDAETDELQARKMALVRWVIERGLEIGNPPQELENITSTSKILQHILTALCTGDLSVACELATASGNYRLALILSQAQWSGPDFRTSLLHQLADWADKRLTFSYSLKTFDKFSQTLTREKFLISPLLTRLYELCSGVPPNGANGTVGDASEYEKGQLGWVQVFGLCLLYHTNSELSGELAQGEDGSNGLSTISEALETYEREIGVDPVAIFTLNHERSDWSPFIPSDHGIKISYANHIVPVSFMDCCYHILRLYSRKGYPLQYALSPLTQKARVCDYINSFALLSFFRSRGYGGSKDGMHAFQKITSRLLAQLLPRTKSPPLHPPYSRSNNDFWTIFLCLLKLSSPKKGPLESECIGAVEKILFLVDLLSRSLHSLITRKELGSGRSDAKLDFISKVNRKLKIPNQYFCMAQVILGKYHLQPEIECWYLIKAGIYNQGHQLFIDKVAPCILNKYDDVTLLNDYLDPLNLPHVTPNINDWTRGGLIYLNYIAYTEWLTKLNQTKDINNSNLASILSSMLDIILEISQLPTKDSIQMFAKDKMARNVSSHFNSIFITWAEQRGLSTSFSYFVKYIPKDVLSAINESFLSFESRLSESATNKSFSQKFYNEDISSMLKLFRSFGVYII